MATCLASNRIDTCRHEENSPTGCQYKRPQKVKGHLPKQTHALVDRTVMRAYQCGAGRLVRVILQHLIDSLKETYPGAAHSLAEGLGETLSVHELGLRRALRQSLQATNLNESAFSMVRQVSKNVKRWRSGRMAERWAAFGLIEAEKRFRKITCLRATHRQKGYRDLPILVTALHKKKKALDRNAVAYYHE